eukprot:2057872-Rhodomonas_salina.2
MASRWTLAPSITGSTIGGESITAGAPSEAFVTITTHDALALERRANWAELRGVDPAELILRGVTRGERE